MTESNYWTRFWRRRLSRRRLLAGTALTGSGLAVATVVGCGGGGGEGGGTPGGTRSPGASPGGSPGADPGPIDSRRVFDAQGQLKEPAPAGISGGTLRYTGFDPVVLDRYDPHQTQFGPMYANTSAVFSKLYMYSSHSEPTWENIVPDLAESVPEMVEDPPLTYIVHLRRGVKFHDNANARKNFPSLAGRELTADDVIFSFERQRNPTNPQTAPFYYRRSQYETIEAITKVDDYTIQIKSKAPVAPFYHFLADTNAMIIPREIVEKDKDTVDVTTGPKPEERMIGTGPFMWDKLVWGTEFKAVRNPNWFGWGQPELGRPWLDAYSARGDVANDDSTVEALFREKKLDTAGYVDNPGWLFSIKEEIPDLLLFMGHTSGWVNSRLKTYCPPFDDPRVRKALHLAVDRQQVVDVIGSGQWKMQGPVGGAIKYWALPEDELMALPGYRQGPEREQDIAEARALFEAAGSPDLPQVWNADTPNYIPRFMPTWVETMKRNLGLGNIRTQTNSYSRIAEGLLRGCDQIAMGWAFDNGWIDLDDWVYPYFRTGASKNSFKVSDPALDELLDDQRREFNADRRKQLGYEIQRYLLGLDASGRPVDPLPPGALVRLDYASPAGPTISWPYYKNRVSYPWFGNSFWNANIWFDSNDPSYEGRPS